MSFDEGREIGKTIRNSETLVKVKKSLNEIKKIRDETIYLPAEKRKEQFKDIGAALVVIKRMCDQSTSVQPDQKVMAESGEKLKSLILGMENRAGIKRD